MHTAHHLGKDVGREEAENAKEVAMAAADEYHHDCELSDVKVAPERCQLRSRDSCSRLLPNDHHILQDCEGVSIHVLSMLYCMHAQ